LLGLGEGDVVVVPTTAYPTYEVGARLAGATVIPADDVAAREGADRVRLAWVHAPAHPTGAALARDASQRVLATARHLRAVAASDECYAELPWTPAWVESGVPSVLADEVTNGDRGGLLAAYSLSKQSNLAGYRAAFIAGDRELLAKISLLRRHLGMMVPTPVLAAMVAALDDDAHVREGRERYGRRRGILLEALTAAGLTIDHSEAGLYLWAR